MENAYHHIFQGHHNTHVTRFYYITNKKTQDTKSPNFIAIRISCNNFIDRNCGYTNDFVEDLIRKPHILKQIKQIYWKGFNKTNQ